MHLVVPVKIHNPTRRKKAMFEKAFMLYRKNYSNLLSIAKENAEELEKQAWKTREIKDKEGNKKAINYLKSARLVAGVLRKLYKVKDMSSVLAEGMYMDSAQSILSHFALKRVKIFLAQVKDTRDMEKERLLALEKLRHLAFEDMDYDTHLEKEGELRAQVAKEPKARYSIFLIRSRYITD